MPSTLKRVAIVGTFLLVVVGIGVGLWYVFFRKPASTLPTPTATSTINGLPQAGNGSPTPGSGITVPGTLPGAGTLPGQNTNNVQGSAPETSRSALLATNVTKPISTTPGSGSDVRYYNATDGRFYRMHADGTQVALSDKQFFNVDTVAWGKATDKAILTFPDRSKLFYDFTQERQAPLPAFWQEPDFSPDDSQIALKSVGRSATNRFLVIASPDGNDAKAVEELGANQDKVQVSWSPNNQMVAFSHTGEAMGQDRESVLLIGKEHENFQSLITDGRGLIPNWSPSGKILAYSVYNTKNDFRPLLWVSGATADTVNAGRRNLNLSTWADKCAWQSELVLICGVPIDLPAGAGLQRELFASVPDTIYRINVGTGQATVLGPLEGNGSIGQISITPGSDTAFVTDAHTGKLFRFALE